MTFMQFYQCWLDELEYMSLNSVDPTGGSWRKSPAKIIENPPKGLFPSLMTLSLVSSVLRILSFMNDTSSTTRIRFSCHSFMSSRLSAFCLLRNAAFDIVIPPNNYAAAPVYAVNKNVVSLHMTPTATQNS
jgi:hypothetical protein